MDWLRRVSETHTALHVSCLSIKISSKTKKTKPNPKFPLPCPPRVPLPRPGSRRGGRELGGRSRPAAGPERLSEVGRDEVRRPGRRRGALAGSRSGSVPLTFAPVVGRHLAAAFISSLPSGAPATAPRGGIWPLCPGRRCGRPASPAESSRWCRGDGASPVRRRLEVQVSEGVNAARPPGCPVVSTGARRCPSALGEPNADVERAGRARAPARPPGPRAGPAWRRPFRVDRTLFSLPRVPLRRVPTDPGPRGMARPGTRGPVRGPSRGPVAGRASAGMFTQVPIGRRDRTPPARVAGEVVPGPCACSRGTVSRPVRAVGAGAGPCGEARGGRGGWTGTGARAGSRSARLDFSSPAFPPPEAGRPAGWRGPLEARSSEAPRWYVSPRAPSPSPSAEAR